MNDEAISQSPWVDPALVRRLCGVTADSDILHDAFGRLGGLVMTTPARAPAAIKLLNAHGIASHDLEDGPLHLTGWDRRLLHWRVGAILAGVDDLRSGWVSTAELAWYHHDRQILARVEPDWLECRSTMSKV